MSDLRAWKSRLAAALEDGMTPLTFALWLIDAMFTHPGRLGRFCRGFLHHAHSPQQQGQRFRDVLPLAAPSLDSARAWKVTSRGSAAGTSSEPGPDFDGPSACAVAAELWVFIQVMLTNYQYAGTCGEEAWGHHSHYSAAQVNAVEVTREAVSYFLGGDLGRVQLPLLSEISTRASSAYDIDSGTRALPLRLGELRPGLPAADVAGRLDPRAHVSPEVLTWLDDPSVALLPRAQWPSEVPKARLLVDSPAEWARIVGHLYSLGIVEAIEDEQIFRADGVPVLNGAFAVEKRGVPEAGEQRQCRFIMNMVPANSYLKIMTQDLSTLTASTSWVTVVLEGQRVLLWSGDDQQGAFFVWKIPRAWRSFTTLKGRVPGRLVGRPDLKTAHVCSAVIPMGWLLAVTLFQHLHRRLGLRPPPAGAGLPEIDEWRRDKPLPIAQVGGCRSWYQFFIDDFDAPRIVNDTEGEVGVGSAYQKRQRASYQRNGVAWAERKAHLGETKVERMGVLVDGLRGRVSVPLMKLFETMLLGALLVTKDWVYWKTMLVLLGKLVRALEFRRVLFCILNEVWKFADGTHSGWVNSEMTEEILSGVGLLPLAFTDLRAEVDARVTCSDASEDGGGARTSLRLCPEALSKLTAAAAAGQEGRQHLMAGRLLLGEASLWRAWESRNPGLPPPAGDKIPAVLVIGLFDGIGGMIVSLSRLRTKIIGYVSSEVDPSARRVVRKRWPGLIDWGNIQDVGTQHIDKLVQLFGGIVDVVYCGAGSPCQDLSRLMFGRRGLEGQKSALFREIPRILGLLNAAFPGKVRSLVENVASMPFEDIERISSELQVTPCRFCSSCLVPNRRPRLYWLSWRLLPCKGYSYKDRGHFVEVISDGAARVELPWTSPGWIWNGGPLPVPTLVCARPSLLQPTRPAGIARASPEAKARWKKDDHRYHVGLYENACLLQHEATMELRPPSAEEREVLLGFDRGYTECAVKDGSGSSLETTRCFLLGNSFSVYAVSWLLQHSLVADEFQPQLWEPHALCHTGKCRAPWNDSAVYHQGDDYQYEPEAEQLVRHYLSIAERGGTDVRLDVHLPFRHRAWPRVSLEPSVWTWKVISSYRWRAGIGKHINALEIQAAVNTIKWRLRSGTGRPRRMLHLIDSQVAASVLTKGRSSSRVLRMHVKRWGALCWATGCYVMLGYIALQRLRGSQRLSDLRASAVTLKRYRIAVAEFLAFAIEGGFPLNSSAEADSALGAYVEDQWANEGTLSHGRYALAGCLFFAPELRTALPFAWSLVKTWQKLAPINRAYPASPEMALGLAGAAVSVGQPLLAALVLVTFDAMLRTKELRDLTYDDITFAEGGVILRLSETKMGVRTGNVQFVVVRTPAAVNLLRVAAERAQPTDHLCPYTYVQLQRLLKSLLAVASIPPARWSWYSFRSAGDFGTRTGGGLVKAVLDQEGMEEHLTSDTEVADDDADLEELRHQTSLRGRAGATVAFTAAAGSPRAPGEWEVTPVLLPEANSWGQVEGPGAYVSGEGGGQTLGGRSPGLAGGVPSGPRGAARPSSTAAPVRNDLPLVGVLSFLDTPVRRRWFVATLDGDVRVFRAQIAGATRTPGSDVVLGFKSEVMVDGRSLRDYGIVGESEIVATRKIRGGGDSGGGSENGQSFGWSCRRCLTPNRCGLECAMCGTPNPNLPSGDCLSDGLSDSDDDLGSAVGCGDDPNPDVMEPPVAADLQGPSFAAVLDQHGVLWAAPLGEVIGAGDEAVTAAPDSAPAPPVGALGAHGGDALPAPLGEDSLGQVAEAAGAVVFEGDPGLALNGHPAPPPRPQQLMVHVSQLMEDSESDSDCHAGAPPGLGGPAAPAESPAGSAPSEQAGQPASPSGQPEQPGILGVSPDASVSVAQEVQRRQQLLTAVTNMGKKGSKCEVRPNARRDEQVLDGRPGVVLRYPGDTASAAYVDNFLTLGQDPGAVASRLYNVVKLLRGLGLVVHELEGASRDREFLGMSLRDGRYLSVKSRNVWRLRYALDDLLARPRVSGHLLRVVAGHITWTSLVRRECLSLLHATYAFIQAAGSSPRPLWSAVRQELESVRNLLPLLCVDLQAEWHPYVACTDASPFGLGVVRRKLSRVQVQELGRQKEKFRFKTEGGAQARHRALEAVGVDEETAMILEHEEGPLWACDARPPDEEALEVTEFSEGRWATSCPWLLRLATVRWMLVPPSAPEAQTARAARGAPAAPRSPRHRGWASAVGVGALLVGCFLLPHRLGESGSMGWRLWATLSLVMPFLLQAAPLTLPPIKRSGLARARLGCSRGTRRRRGPSPARPSASAGQAYHQWALLPQDMTGQLPIKAALCRETPTLGRAGRIRPRPEAPPSTTPAEAASVYPVSGVYIMFFAQPTEQWPPGRRQPQQPPLHQRGAVRAITRDRCRARRMPCHGQSCHLSRVKPQARKSRLPTALHWPPAVTLSSDSPVGARFAMESEGDLDGRPHPLRSQPPAALAGLSGDLPSLAAVGEGRLHRRFVFVELFCGAGCITASLKADGFSAIGFDIGRGAHENHLVHEFFEVLQGWITSGCIAGIWLGTPCTTWSQALRRPLRSRRHPMGLPGLSVGEQARLEVGNLTFKFSCKVIRLAVKWNIAVYLENPAGSLMWHAPELARLLHAPCAQKIQLHMCQFGAPWRKCPGGKHERDHGHPSRNYKQGKCRRANSHAQPRKPLARRDAQHNYRAVLIVQLLMRCNSQSANFAAPLGPLRGAPRNAPHPRVPDHAPARAMQPIVRGDDFSTTDASAGPGAARLRGAGEAPADGGPPSGLQAIPEESAHSDAPTADAEQHLEISQQRQVIHEACHCHRWEVGAGERGQMNEDEHLDETCCVLGVIEAKFSHASSCVEYTEVKQTKRVTSWMIRIFFSCTVAFSIPVTSLISVEAFWKGAIMGAGPCIFTKVVCAIFMGPSRFEGGGWPRRVRVPDRPDGPVRRAARRPAPGSRAAQRRVRDGRAVLRLLLLH
ncbi:unnamed protein product, partial [Prorocentrum cordatum]